MDVAYDQIQEEALSPHEPTAANPFDKDPSKAEGSKSSDDAPQAQRPLSSDLNTEFREAYQTIASTAWGAKLGGLWGTVRKQGESYYTSAAKELSNASREASKASTSSSADLIHQAPSPSPDQQPTTSTTTATSSEPPNTSPNDATPPTNPPSITPSTTPTLKSTHQPTSLPADIALEATSMFSALRVTASSRLKQLQKAEDAADEALLHFGSNVRDFFRDAVTITPPSDGTTGKKGDVLFESTASGTGARTIHATRTDAHLHVLHTNPASFTSPQSTVSNPAYPAWKDSTAFDVEKKTEDIARDLGRYPELRKMMETLVPGQIAYGEFWARYYFLRHVIEEEERRRRELLAKSLDEEEVGWDDEDEEAEGGGKGTPTQEASAKGGDGLLKPNEPRRSNEGQSVADSDASYDIVSQGVASRGPDSPKEEEKKKFEKKDDSDEEEDWE